MFTILKIIWIFRPFYGYHRSEHQFLKVYMFNPRFIRRAANLLQNGVVLDKNFHPHESHVPYVLQFMIDYNLYGMSYLHVPQDTLKFRCLDNKEVLPLNGINPCQMQDSNQVKKVSCSILELDVNSCFILNRFQLLQSVKSNSTTASRSHTNPGIEALWSDEKLRRQQLIKECEGNAEKLEQVRIEHNIYYMKYHIDVCQKI